MSLRQATKKITNKLVVAATLATRGQRYWYSAFSLLLVGLLLLLYRIKQGLTYGADVSSWPLLAGALSISTGWWCFKVSQGYFDDLKRYKG